MKSTRISLSIPSRKSSDTSLGDGVAWQAQRSGSIINISSTYGHEGAAFASICVGAKHAVGGITKSAALKAASREFE